jgi:hypothetical protein
MERPGRGDTSRFIYHPGHPYRAGQGAGPLSHTTSTETLIVNAWYPKSAQATMMLDATQRQTDTYVFLLMEWNPVAVRVPG